MAVKGIQKVEFGTDLDDWATSGIVAPTEIPIDSILKEGFDVGSAEEFITELANETEELDGIKRTGTINVKFDETSIPADGAVILLQITPESGPAIILGGVNGAKVRIKSEGLRPLSGGQWFKTITFTYAGADDPSTIKAWVDPSP